MSKSQHLKHILAQAKEKEKYNWLGAIEFYENALDRVLKQKDFLEAGDIGERIGYCFYQAAFQAKTQKEFRRRMRMAVEAYEKAAEQFEKAEKRIRGDHCKALAIWANYWFPPSYAEKKVLLDECIGLWKKVATDYGEAGDWFRYGKACNELLGCLLDRFEIEQNWSNRKEILMEGLDYGEKAIATFSELADDYELTRAYYLTSFHCFWAARFSELELEQREELNQKCLTFAKRALELSKKVGDSHLIAMSNIAATYNQYWLVGNLKLSMEHAKKIVHHGTITKDHYFIGCGLAWLAAITYWMMMQEEDPDKKREGYRKTIEYAKEAASHLNLLSSYAFSGDTVWVQIESHASWARDVETKPEEKRTLLKRAIEIGRKAVKRVKRSGNPESTASTLHALSKALFFLSQMETVPRDKKELLIEASKLREEDIIIRKRSLPNWYWIRGVGHNYKALILAELSLIENDDRKKRSLLEKAVLNMEKCLKLCAEWTRFYPQTMLLVPLGMYYDWSGTILNQLYSLTGETKNLYKMIEVYKGAVKTYNKAGMRSRLAEMYWKIARVYNQLDEHTESAENFELASKNYKVAAEKMPQLKNFYSDYATYMQAWSEIEKAKLAHKREEYARSEKHYNRAAHYLQSSTLWNYLALNYSAWSLLEHAEHLSRQEKNQESIQVFQRVAEMFNEAKKSLDKAQSKIVDPYEKEKISDLSRACDGRREYCLGRVSVEKARVFDREGDYESSAKRYGSAAKAFEKILEKIEIKSDRRELQSTVYLCQAWQKMKLAEERLDPTLYAEASQLFMKAKESSLKKRTSLLATGNSHFCKALEFGARFKDTRNMELYSKTKQYMESASDCYTEAGFNKESFWVNATQVLFDSYVYMGKAETEVDPDKKLRHYLLAERFLDRSANLFEKAGYLRKRNEVLRSIEKVKQKREFMLSLREVLSAPSIASSTSSISAPAPTHEEAVGLERFEQAYVQANLIIRPKEVNVGEDLGLEIKLVNTGKESASLVKVEEILPRGFEPVAKPDYCHFEDAYVDMKGKKLNPLKTEEIRLVLRSFDKGTFAMKPRIIYVDETGHQMFCEPEPVTINVSEVILPGRITTGYRDLDNLLFGGIPENYAIILSSPSCDERDLLIKRFLKTGAIQGEVTFYVTIDASGAKILVEDFQSNLYLFICNPQADEIIESLPNVFKLKGVENLTEISIALTSAFRRLDASLKGPRRACIEIVSDVLLQHHALHTRRWLTGLIPELKSRGFTTLAVINPQMHPPQEVQAILDLFEGEINIYEKETEKGLEKFLKVKKMYNQRYLQSKLPLRKEKLER